MTAEIQGFLTLRGDALTPARAEASLGERPTKVLLPPGHGKDSRKHVKVPRCSYASGLDKDRTLEEHVIALVDRFHARANQLRELRESHGIEVLIDVIVECYEGYTPPIFLEPDLLRRMSDLGAAFWIDLYTFDGPPNPTDTRGT